MDSTKKIEIFYAEDKKSDRILFDLALHEIDIPTHLITANNGQEAMELVGIDHFRPDIIFLNLRMPRMGGIDCLREIRKIGRFDHTPVIIFSMTCEEKHIKEAYKEKANMYLQKPFDITQQIKVMKKILTMDWQEYFPQPKEKKFVFQQKVSMPL